MTKKAALLMACCLQAGVGLWVFIPFAQDLDQKFQTSGLLTLLVVVGVMGLWFYQLVGLARSHGKRQKPPEKKRTLP